MWHIARKFIMHVFIMPLPFLVPVVFIEYLLYKNVLSAQTGMKERTHLFRPLKMACYACYCIQAFYFYFFITGKNNSTRSCVREFYRDDISVSKFRYCFHQELPQRMLARLHLIRRFSLGLWGWLLGLIAESVKCFRSSWPSCTDSISIFSCGSRPNISFWCSLLFCFNHLCN